jgi:hypothetical protein
MKGVVLLLAVCGNVTCIATKEKALRFQHCVDIAKQWLSSLFLWKDYWWSTGTLFNMSCPTRSAQYELPNAGTEELCRSDLTRQVPLTVYYSRFLCKISHARKLGFSVSGVTVASPMRSTSTRVLSGLSPATI